jgi:ribosomal protein S18 acetylase RimI-like enzyme
MNTQNITIRNATLEDVDNLVELLRELFSIEADFTFDRARQLRGLRLLLAEDINRRCVLVAEAAGKIVGMCSAQTRVSTAEGKVTAVIEDVVVTDKWRGKGLGFKLMKGIERWGRMRNIECFQLLADKNNLSGIAFYKKQSWEVTQLICLTKKVH